VDVGSIAVAIKDIVLGWWDRATDAERRRLKSSVASVSARMSRIAAVKQSLADFLQDKPALMSEFPLEQRVVAKRALKELDNSTRV
jgi:hypothetical protein